jgi:cobalt-zinc-cadmium efflux system protein
MNDAVPPSSASARHRNRLWLAFLITSGILVLEIVGGVLSDSLALLADAGHMATDVAGIGLSLFAIGLATRKPDEGRTFGLLRAEILAAAANAVLLFGVAAFVLWEAWHRLQEPSDVAAGLMLAIAIVGAAANAISLWLLHDAQRESLNMRGAYLEVLGDLLGSLAVVVAAVVIATTGFVAADSIASAVIAVLILPRTWKLLREAIDVLLEATPRGVDMAEVRRHILETAGVADVHDLHAWTITSGMNVLSAHVVLEPSADPAAVLELLSDCLANDFDIEHSTFQLETSDRRRLEEGTHR